MRLTRNPMSPSRRLRATRDAAIDAVAPAVEPAMERVLQAREWTHKAAERAHSMSDDARQRVHLAGDALLGHQPRRRWPATIGALILGVAVGVITTVASLRPRSQPQEPTSTGNENEALESAPVDEVPNADPTVPSDGGHSHSVAKDTKVP